MKVRVETIGGLKRSGPDSKPRTAELEEQSTVEQLVISGSEEGLNARNVVPVVNGRIAKMSQILSDGDAVRLILPVAGG